MRTILLFSLLVVNMELFAIKDSVVYLKTKDHNVYEKIYFNYGTYTTIALGTIEDVDKENKECWKDYYKVVLCDVEPCDVVKRYVGPYLKDLQLTKEDDDFTILIRHGLDGRFLHIMYVCTIKLDHIPIEVFEQIDNYLKEYGNMKEVTSIPRQPVDGIYYISMMLPCSLIEMQESVFLNSSECPQL
ncbi:hypothetical protein AB9N12_02435 [Bacteroides sp. AN502(2024)]|uniref:hypothetical protein n=1 Tax=Bacteroides sp. AN502(2024) TaxID=3160599 RepID=UPI003513C1BA